MKKVKIMIVEDEQILARRMAADLEKMGYEICGNVDSGEAAVELVKNEGAPDLIIMDIRLGKALNGIETARQVQEHQEIPIIFLTGYNEDEVVKSARFNFPYVYLRKPVELVELKSVVEMALGVALSNGNLKRSIDELQESESRFRSIIHHTAAGYFFIDREGIIQQVNDAWVKMYKYKSADEIVGQHFVTIQQPDDIDLAKETVDGVMRGNSGFLSGEFSRKCKDGSIGYHTYTANPVLRFKQVVGIEGFIIDTSHRKQAEVELRESEEKYRLLVEMSNDGVCLLTFPTADNPGSFIEANRAYCRMVGYSRTELEQLSVLDTAVPEEIDHLGNIKTQVEADKSIIFETSLLHKDGRRIPVEMNVHQFEREGKPVILSVVRDITQRRLVEAERDRLYQQMAFSQKMEALGTMAGGVAHEFNNLLHIILGSAHIIKKNLPPDPKSSKSIDNIETAGQRATGLVKQVLAFARQDTAGQSPIEMRSVIEETFNMIRSTVSTAIVINISIPSNQILVKANSTEIQQAIINICNNAELAMPEGGVLSVGLESVNLDETEAMVLNVKSGPYAKISIQDSGCGIPEDDIPRLFDPFFTTREIGQGAGLGLSVAHGIIQKHQGAIQIDSAPGTGTAVLFYLLALDIEVDRILQKEDLIYLGKLETILLVDDEEMLVELIQDQLESLNYVVTATTSSKNALSLLKQNEYDLLITDQEMPEITGLDLIHEARLLNPDQFVIVMTGYSKTASQEVVEDLNCSYILKPISVPDLSQLIRESLQ
jgi:PAS domain S-box-containing protein